MVIVAATMSCKNSRTQRAAETAPVRQLVGLPVSPFASHPSEQWTSHFPGQPRFVFIYRNCPTVWVNQRVAPVTERCSVLRTLWRQSQHSAARQRSVSVDASRLRLSQPANYELAASTAALLLGTSLMASKTYSQLEANHNLTVYSRWPHEGLTVVSRQGLLHYDSDRLGPAERSGAGPY